MAHSSLFAYAERESFDPQTGEEGVLRDEWMLLPLNSYPTPRLVEAFGERWYSGNVDARFVIEHRYIRRGVEEPWKPFDLVASGEDAARTLLAGSANAERLVGVSPVVDRVRSQQSEEERARLKAQDEQERLKEAVEAGVRRRRQGRNAFDRLMNNAGWRDLGKRWNEFVERFKGSRQVDAWRGDQEFRSLYDAVLDATTVPAKARALKAFLARYEKVERTNPGLRPAGPGRRWWEVIAVISSGDQKTFLTVASHAREAVVLTKKQNPDYRIVRILSVRPQNPPQSYGWAPRNEAERKASLDAQIRRGEKALHEERLWKAVIRARNLGQHARAEHLKREYDAVRARADYMGGRYTASAEKYIARAKRTDPSWPSWARTNAPRRSPGYRDPDVPMVYPETHRLTPRDGKRLPHDFGPGVAQHRIPRGSRLGSRTLRATCVLLTARDGRDVSVPAFSEARRITMRRGHGKYRGEDFFHDFGKGVSSRRVPSGTRIVVPSGRSFVVRGASVLLESERGKDLVGRFPV